jgi:hypothetical protein
VHSFGKLTFWKVIVSPSIIPVDGKNILASPQPESSEMPNFPGTVEDLHKACQSVFPMYFEGAKVLINKGLSSHFQVSVLLNFFSSSLMLWQNKVGCNFFANFFQACSRYVGKVRS